MSLSQFVGAIFDDFLKDVRPVIWKACVGWSSRRGRIEEKLEMGGGGRGVYIWREVMHNVRGTVRFLK